MHTVASYSANSLQRMIINPDISQPLQTMIDSNNGNEIILIGDYTHLAKPGKKFQVYNYRVQRHSPAVDTGTSTDAPATDLVGRHRPFDMPKIGANGTGTEYDIGAYERYWESGANRWQAYQ